MAKEDLNTRYRFAGDGLGVPGLAHDISMQEAIDAGVEKLLESAIKNGAYVSVETTSRSTSPPTPLLKERGDKNKEK